MDKKIDETWKDKVGHEQVQDTEKGKEQPTPPANFSFLISSLGIQALIALGEIENPITQKKDKDISQAKYLIDTIEMLQQKTKGNLDAEEEKTVDQILFELRTKYIAANK